LIETKYNNFKGGGFNQGITLGFKEYIEYVQEIVSSLITIYH